MSDDPIESDVPAADGADAVAPGVVEPDAVLDVRGLRCPLPVIRLATLVRDDPAVRRVRVLATDPATAHDLPAWCRLRGHAFVGSTALAEHTEYDVEVRPTAPAAGR